MSVNQEGGSLRIHQVHKLPTPIRIISSEPCRIIPILTCVSIICGGGAGGVREKRNLAGATIILI